MGEVAYYEQTITCGADAVIVTQEYGDAVAYLGIAKKYDGDGWPDINIRLTPDAIRDLIRVLEGVSYARCAVCDAALVDDPSGDLCDDCVDEEEGE